MPPELALLDVNLIGQGSGLDLARHLRERYGTPCLLATAMPDVALTAADVVVGVLREPFEPRDAPRSVEVI